MGTIIAKMYGWLAFFAGCEYEWGVYYYLVTSGTSKCLWFNGEKELRIDGLGLSVGMCDCVVADEYRDMTKMCRMSCPLRVFLRRQ